MKNISDTLFTLTFHHVLLVCILPKDTSIPVVSSSANTNVDISSFSKNT